MKLVIFTFSLVFGIKAHAADVRISTEELQKVLDEKSTRTSLRDAYIQLHGRLVEIAGQIDESADSRLKRKNPHEKEKFANIVTSLSLFLGRNDRASTISTDYSKHVDLIDLVRPYVQCPTIEHWLDFSKARLLRLMLKSEMRNLSQTSDEADPDHLKRAEIWRLLNHHTSAPKIFLYEKAYLVAHYQYFPTKNKVEDCKNAIQLLKELIDSKRRPRKKPYVEERFTFVTSTLEILPERVEQKAKKTAVPRPNTAEINRCKKDARNLTGILKAMIKEARSGLTEIDENSDDISSDDSSKGVDSDTEMDCTKAAPVTIAAAHSSSVDRCLSSTSHAASRKKQPQMFLAAEDDQGDILSPAAKPSGFGTSFDFGPLSPMCTTLNVPTNRQPSRPRASWGQGIVQQRTSAAAISSDVDELSTATAIDSMLYQNPATQQVSSAPEVDASDSEGDRIKGHKRKKTYTIKSSSDEDNKSDASSGDSDSEHEHAASSLSSALPIDERNNLIRVALEQLGEKETWTQKWTHKEIAKKAGQNIRFWDVTKYIAEFAPELKKYTRQDQTQQQITDERIRDAIETNARLIEINPGAKILTRVEIAEKLNRDSTHPRVTDAMIAHYIDRRGTDLKGLRAQLAEDRRSRIAEAIAQNDAGVANGERSKTHAQIAADAGEDINAGMVMHYLTEFDTRPKQPPKPKAPILTDDQKDEIQRLLALNKKMSHKDVAREVERLTSAPCKSTQVSKHVDKYAPHLKKHRLKGYERRPTDEIERSDQQIMKIIDNNPSITNAVLCRTLGANVTDRMIHAFYKRYPSYQPSKRKP